MLFLPLVAKDIEADMTSEETPIKHKGGRPKKTVSRTVTSLRLSNIERYIIKSKAREAGLNITTYIRQMAINGKVISKMTEEERHFVRDFVGIANNLNQLTKKAHQEGLMSSFIFFDKYKKDFDEFLKRFKNDK